MLHEPAVVGDDRHERHDLALMLAVEHFRQVDEVLLAKEDPPDVAHVQHALADGHLLIDRREPALRGRRIDHADTLRVVPYARHRAVGSAARYPAELPFPQL